MGNEQTIVCPNLLNYLPPNGAADYFAIGDAVTAQIGKGQLSGDAIATLKASATAATDQIQGLPHAQRRVFLQLIARIDLCEQRMTIDNFKKITRYL